MLGCVCLSKLTRVSFSMALGYTLMFISTGDHCCACPSPWGFSRGFMQLEIARQDGRTASAKRVLWGTLGQQDTACASVYAQGFRGQRAQLRAGVKPLALVSLGCVQHSESQFNPLSYVLCLF